MKSDFRLRYEVMEQGNPPVEPPAGICFTYAGETMEEARQTLMEYAQSIQHVAHILHLPWHDNFSYVAHRSQAVIHVWIEGQEETTAHLQVRLRWFLANVRRSREAVHMRRRLDRQAGLKPIRVKNDYRRSDVGIHLARAREVRDRIRARAEKGASNVLL